MTQLNLDIKTKLDELEQLLLTNHPNMATALRDIHKTLKAQPDIVTLMSEEEIAIVVQGLAKQTNSQLVASTLKPSASKKKALTKVTSDELGF